MRLMMWNIQSFTGNKFYKIHKLWGDNTEYNEDYILDMVVAVNPDIFVVIEVRTSYGNIGSLVAGNGKIGVLHLLDALRHDSRFGDGADWMLVPPLKLGTHLDPGYTEAVAVYYDNAEVEFTGPWYWNKQYGSAHPDQTNDKYPGNWGDCLPEGNNRAGKIRFYSPEGDRLYFPLEASRPPFRTDFVERHGDRRGFKLFSVHFPPGPTPKRMTPFFTPTVPNEPPTEAMAQFQRIEDYGVWQDNQVWVVGGDFNYDPRPGIAHHTLSEQRYNLFRQFVSVPKILAPTAFEQVQYSSLWGNPPGYGYLADACFDNFCVRYTPNTLRPNNHFPTVMNAVIGGQMDPDHRYPRHMESSIEEILSWNTYLDEGEQIHQFRLAQNFGHIGPGRGGVSDHLPIVIDL